MPTSTPALPQYIRLASVSMGNTVVVDTLALAPLHPKKQDSRYVLSHPSDVKRTQTLYVVLISFIVLMAAIVAQGFFAPESATTSAATSFLPPGARQWLHKPANVAHVASEQVESAASSALDALPSTPQLPSKQRLRDLLHLDGGAADTKAVVLRQASLDTDLSLDVVPDRAEYLKQDSQARHWHELDEHEKSGWREALVKAGHWTVDEGEAVLKGVLFSSYAGLVGQAGQAAAQAIV